MLRYKKHTQNESPLKYIELQRPRGYEIICLAAKGLTNKEIAKILHIVPSTVRNQLTDLYFSYDAKNRAHLVAKAIQAGVKVFDE